MNRKEYKKAWYEANKDEIAARGKAYREANKDKIAARAKAWYEANKDEIAARRKANPDKMVAYYKAYKESNKDKIAAQNKAYRAENKDKIAAYHKNKEDETWQEVYKHLGTKCSCPTCTYSSKHGLQVDHILPRNIGPHKDGPRGGLALRKYIIKHQCWNDFQLLCGSCNQLKHQYGTCICGDDQPDLPNQPNSTALWLGSIQASDLAMSFLLANRPQNEPRIDDLCHPDQSPY